MSMAVMAYLLVDSRADTMAVPMKPHPPVTKTRVGSIEDAREDGAVQLMQVGGLFSTAIQSGCSVTTAAVLVTKGFEIHVRDNALVYLACPV